MSTNKDVNMGASLKSAIDSAKYKVDRGDLANYMKISRSHLYNLIYSKEFSLKHLKTAGEFLKYDFSDEYPELKTMNLVEEPAADYGNLSNKSKLLIALEEISALKQQIILLQKENFELKLEKARK